MEKSQQEDRRNPGTNDLIRPGCSSRLKCDYCGKQITGSFKTYTYRFHDPESMCDHVDDLTIFVCENEWCQEQTIYRYEYDGIREVKDV